MSSKDSVSILALKAAAKVREVGFLYFAILGLQRLMPHRFVSVTNCLILELPIRDLETETSIGRWADFSDIARLTQLGHSEKEIDARLRRGDLAWILDEGPSLIGYCWFTSGHYRDEISGVEWAPQPHEVWLYDAMIAKEHRGRGLYPRLLSGAAKQLGVDGFHRIWIITEALNRNSISAHLKAGALVRKRLLSLKVLNWRRVRTRDINSGQDVSLDQLSLGE